MNVIVPFDLDADTGAYALNRAAEMFADSDDVMVYAVHLTDTQNETVDNVIMEEARRLMSVEENGQLDEDQIVVEVQPVKEETPEYIVPAIKQYARENNADQIVMSKQERSLLEKLLQRSNTESLIGNGVAPVTRVS